MTGTTQYISRILENGKYRPLEKTMSLKTNLVASTGCEQGDVLIGAQPVNRNMRIQVFFAQDKGDNSQIKGGLRLLESGSGRYGPALDEFVGRHFNNARELVELLRQKPGAKECTFILHKDMLEVEAPTARLTDTDSPEGKEIERIRKAREQSAGPQTIREPTPVANLQNVLGEWRVEMWSKPSQVERDGTFVDWLETLPFPLASILWRYETTRRPKDQLEVLTKFFEALAEFLSTVLLSAAKADETVWSAAQVMLSRYREQLEKSSFGVWVNVAAATAKSLRTIHNKEHSDAAIRESRVERMLGTKHSEFVQALFSKRMISVLQKANAHRNTYMGHGGILTDRLAANLLPNLQVFLAEVRSCYDMHWNPHLLILPTTETHWTAERFNVVAQILRGSRSPFRMDVCSLVAPLKAGVLYFLDPTEDHALELLPLIKMDSPPMSESTACYFYNRIQPDGVRYISYNYASEAERKYTPDEARAVLRDLFGR
jgi:hypothetical protein